VGSLDGVRSSGVDAITVDGWAADPNAAGTDVAVHIYVSGPAGRVGYSGAVASEPRPDVAAVVPWAGAGTGFSTTVRPSGAGPNQVCAFAIGATPTSGNTLLGCRSVLVQDATGSLDAVTTDGPTITAAGWAANPNGLGGPTEVHLYDVGPGGRTGWSGIRADRSRPDVGAAYPAFGGSRGWSATVPTGRAGQHQVCAYAIGAGGGTGNVLLACRELTVPSVQGSLDVVAVSGGSLVVAGWASTWAARRTPTPVHVYDTAPDGSVVGYAGMLADRPRPDVAAVVGGAGPATGFSRTIPRRGAGRHTVCVFGVPDDAPPTLLACRSIVV
jgi:hypothetical protein